MEIVFKRQLLLFPLSKHPRDRRANDPGEHILRQILDLPVEFFDPRPRPNEVIVASLGESRDLPLKLLDEELCEIRGE
ncbi:hypothetical protein [Sphingomonas sp.]|uniref:hypothetical protein n=1 Tax=Sphingomonas sp. TaxID=28214 RepID=UPI003F6FC902